MKFGVINYELEKTLNRVLKGQEFDMFLQNSDKMVSNDSLPDSHFCLPQSQGFLVDHEMRMGPRNQRRMAFVSSICSLCFHSITAKPYIKVYAC